MKLKDILTEARAEIQAERLPYAQDALAPVFSEDTIKYHYGKLARGYAERYNAGQGDPDFNYAGNYLQNLFFPQLQPPKGSNKPTGAILALIEQKFKSYEKFQDEFTAEAMKIQGSAWIYLSRSGDIKTITNHAVRKDIALLVDWWEHAWSLDYQHDKAKYLKNIWRIINWDIVNQRL